ncbi:MAG: cache domain-containing protein [Rhodocyclaceae bacterium]
MSADLSRISRPKATIRLQTLLMVMAGVSLLGMLIVSFLLLTRLSTNLNEQKRDTLRARIEMAESLVQHFHTLARKGELTDAEAQVRAIQAMRQLRSLNNEYVWINDIQGRLIQHPFMPELEGKDLGYLKDSNGKSIFLSFVDIALTQGSGFVRYSWPKPNAVEPTPKLSYVKLFAPWQWVIGSGEYLDDIDDAYWKEVRRLIPVLGGISLLFVAMIFWLRRQVLVRVGSDMKDAVSIASQLSHGELHQPLKLGASASRGLLDVLANGARSLGRALSEHRGPGLLGHLARRKDAEDERRHLSEALKQSQEAVVLAEADLTFAYVNPAFTRLFGYTQEELRGQPIDLLKVSDQAGGSPNETSRAAREEGIFHGEVLRRARDGRAIPILIKVAPVFDEYQIVTGYVASMTDLTEIHRAQTALRESEEKFRAIFDQTFQFIGLLDTAGRMLDANRTALTLTGTKAEQVIGKPFWETPWWSHSPELQARVRDGVARAAQGELIRFEATHPAADGSQHYVDFSLKPIHDAAGRITMLIPEGRDITERKRAEDAAHQRLDEITRINAELKELNEQLMQSRKQLLQSEKMASIGVLAAGVAHEINNPVGFIRSNMGSLRNYVMNFLRLIQAYEIAAAKQQDHRETFDEVRRLAQEIEFAYERDDVPTLLDESIQGLERVTKIVQDLKDFSRIDQNERWQQADIHQCLESTLNISRNELKYKCEIRKEFGQLPAIECLPHQLNQVFMNLLVNAAHAIDQHGTITLRTGSGDGQVWIEIADTGKGIPPEHLTQIFDPFFTTKPVGQGTGLGLAVSYGIIEKHHGSIEVDSEVGKGSVFRIHLPISHRYAEADIATTPTA